MASKALVNGRSMKVVNIASTRMMRKIRAARGCFVPRINTGMHGLPLKTRMPGTSPGHNDVVRANTQAWLATALPMAACAAASRAIGTR